MWRETCENMSCTVLDHKQQTPVDHGRCALLAGCVSPLFESKLLLICGFLNSLGQAFRESRGEWAFRPIEEGSGSAQRSADGGRSAHLKLHVRFHKRKISKLEHCLDATIGDNHNLLSSSSCLRRNTLRNEHIVASVPPGGARNNSSSSCSQSPRSQQDHSRCSQSPGNQEEVRRDPRLTDVSQIEQDEGEKTIQNLQKDLEQHRSALTALEEVSMRCGGSSHLELITHPDHSLFLKKQSDELKKTEAMLRWALVDAVCFNLVKSFRVGRLFPAGGGCAGVAVHVHDHDGTGGDGVHDFLADELTGILTAVCEFISGAEERQKIVRGVEMVVWALVLQRVFVEDQGRVLVRGCENVEEVGGKAEFVVESVGRFFEKFGLVVSRGRGAGSVASSAAGGGAGGAGERKKNSVVPERGGESAKPRKSKFAMPGLGKSTAPMRRKSQARVDLAPEIDLSSIEEGRSSFLSEEASKSCSSPTASTASFASTASTAASFSEVVRKPTAGSCRAQTGQPARIEIAPMKPGTLFQRLVQASLSSSSTTSKVPALLVSQALSVDFIPGLVRLRVDLSRAQRKFLEAGWAREFLRLSSLAPTTRIAPTRLSSLAPTTRNAPYRSDDDASSERREQAGRVVSRTSRTTSVVAAGPLPSTSFLHSTSSFSLAELFDEGTESRSGLNPATQILNPVARPLLPLVIAHLKRPLPLRDLARAEVLYHGNEEDQKDRAANEDAFALAREAAEPIVLCVGDQRVSRRLRVMRTRTSPAGAARPEQHRKSSFGFISRTNPALISLGDLEAPLSSLVSVTRTAADRVCLLIRPPAISGLQRQGMRPTSSGGGGTTPALTLWRVKFINGPAACQGFIDDICSEDPSSPPFSFVDICESQENLRKVSEQIALPLCVRVAGSEENLRNFEASIHSTDVLGKEDLAPLSPRKRDILLGRTY